jgi:hypothetical protein
MPDRVTIPEVIDRFRRYHALNPLWGSLHIVLEDTNVDDHHIDFCVDYAVENGDAEGKALAEILLTMSKTQRRKLGAIA